MGVESELYKMVVGGQNRAAVTWRKPGAAADRKRVAVRRVVVRQQQLHSCCLAAEIDHHMWLCVAARQRHEQAVRRQPVRAREVLVAAEATIQKKLACGRMFL